MARKRVRLMVDKSDEVDVRSPHRDQRVKASKLTPDEWFTIQQRVIAGDAVAAIAGDYNISREAIYDRCITGRQNQRRNDQTRLLASQIAKTETNFAALPLTEQVMVRTLADHLKNISNHLAGAATFGARNAHKLSSMAADCIDRLDSRDDPVLNAALMTNAMHATAGANEASKIGLNLLAANKDYLKENPDANVIDMTPHLIRDDDPVAASATYQRLVAGKR